MSSTTLHGKSADWDWIAWFQWILANAIGEMVELGGTLVIGGLLLLNAQNSIHLALLSYCYFSYL